MHQPLPNPPHPPRRKSRRLALAGGLLALFLAIAAIRSVVIVDQAEMVYITEFGRPVRLLTEPGLYRKWPHQSRRGFDRRLQFGAPPPREMLTKDKKNLEVAWYVGWRIVDVERFLTTVRTPADASARLEDMVASVLAAELGGRDLADLVRVGDGSALGPLMGGVTARIAEQAGREYGLSVADVRLRRLNYPSEVREAVFEQIRSERRRVAAATRAEGESQARAIRSAADRERSKAVAQAEADAARLVGEGEATATRIANEAHSADPAFYQFLKTLDTYRSALDGRTTLVLSAESAFLKLLTQGLPEPKATDPPTVARPRMGPSNQPTPAPSASTTPEGGR